MALLLLVLAAGVLAVVRAQRESNDFDGFHRAAVAVVQAGELSGEKSVQRYLPSFPVLMAPLGWLPLAWAAALWFGLSVLALCGLPGQLERLTDVPPAGQRTAFLVAAPLLLDNLLLGQSGPVLLWLAVAGAARCRRGSAAHGGALLGLAAALKVLPLIFVAVPLLCCRGSRRGAALLGLSGAFLATAGVCVLALGGDGAWDGLLAWRQTIGDQTPQRMVDLDRSLRHGNQSLWITLWRTLGDTSAVRVRDWPRLASLSDRTVWTVAGALLSGLVLAGALALAPIRRLGERGFQFLFALCCLGQLLVSPLVWTHYFCWVLPGVLALRRRPRLVAVCGWIFVLGLASPQLRSLGLQLWLAVALLLGLVAEARAQDRSGSPGPEPLS